MATSPAISAFASLPKKAAQVLSPIRALIFAPISRQIQVVAPNGDFVDRPALFALMAYDARDFGCVHLSG